MSARLRFVALAVLFAGALYALYWRAELAWPGASRIGYVAAVVAVMLEAQGAPWRRKLLYAGATVGTAVVALALAQATGLLAAVGAVGATRGATDAQVAAIVTTKLLFIALPLVMLALFVGRQPSALWTRPVQASDTEPGE